MPAYGILIIVNKKGLDQMAKGKTTVTKGVIYTDENGKKHVLNKEEFLAKMNRLAAKGKAKKDSEKS